MNYNAKLISRLNISKEASPTLTVQKIREFLDGQPNPLKTANEIIKTAGLQPIDNRKKAYVFAMTTLENTLRNSKPNITEIMTRANERVERITDMLGPSAFVMRDSNQEDLKSKSPSKRSLAKEIYLENIDKGEKVVIELVQKELSVTKQNAYTYIYLIKKELKQSGT